MAFPHINIKATNLRLIPSLTAQVEKKLLQLEKLLPQNETDLVCNVELEKTTRHHQSGKIYRAEVNLFVRGKLFRVEALEETIDDAIDRAKSELKRELRRTSRKEQSLLRRGGQKIKDFLRFG